MVPEKKAKPSWILYLLAITVIVIISVALIAVFLVLGLGSNARAINGTEIPDGVEGGPSDAITTILTTSTLGTTTSTESSTSKETTESTTTQKQTTSTAGDTTTTEKETTTPQVTDTTTKTAETTTVEEITTTTPRQDISVPIDLDTIVESLKENDELINRCSSFQITKTRCSQSNEDVRHMNESVLAPLHYSLNLTLKSVEPSVVLDGDVRIFVRIDEDTNQISLNVGNGIRGIHNSNIDIINCETGQTLCVSKQSFDSREEILSLIVSELISSGTNLRIELRKFTTVDTQRIVYSQVPTRLNRNAPIVAGSILSAKSAHKLFPSFTNTAYKASLDLCVQHSENAKARSNSNPQSTENGLSCFERTVPLNAHHFTFATFEKAETLVYNQTTINGSYIPSMEIIFSLTQNFKREKHQWIYNEASKVMMLLTQWTGFPYPMNKLTLISAPIHVDAHSSLGIITLKDQRLEYPSHTIVHVILMKEIIHQWLGGVISMRNTKERCFQESLVTYLEWKVNDELHFINRTRHGEFENGRPKDLKQDAKEDVRSMRSLEKAPKCTDRYVSIFYTLDETFGSSTVTGMIREALRNFRFSTMTIADWQAAAVAASGSETAGTVIGEWFSRSSRPILQVTVHPQTVLITQLTNETWTVPLVVGTSDGYRMVTVSHVNTTVPLTSMHYIVFDPKRKSTAFIVYDIETYLRLVRCWEDSRCPSSQDELRGIFRDLGAVFLADLLPSSSVQDGSKWKGLFRFIYTQRILSGDSQCCVSHALGMAADRLCTWVVRDTCSTNRLIRSL